MIRRRGFEVTSREEKEWQRGTIVTRFKIQVRAEGFLAAGFLLVSERLPRHVSSLEVFSEGRGSRL